MAWLGYGIMNRRPVIVVGSISVLGLVMAGLLVPGILFPSSMRWAMHNGFSMSFIVHVSGFHMDPLDSSTYDETTPQYWFLNNTNFVVQISDLPPLESGFTSESFASQILEHLKTSLILPIISANGTELPSSNYLFLNELVSHSLLPVGGWDMIDSFYPDDPEFPYQCDTYLSSNTTTSFLIGHRVYNTDAGFGWNATVDLERGFPLQATTWASQFYGSIWFSYTVTLIFWGWFLLD